MLHAILVFADESTKAAPKGGFGSPQDFLIIGAIGIMMYMLIVVLPRRRRQEQERQDQLKKLNKNDEVLTIGGIYGTIISVADAPKDEIVIKVDDGTRLRMTKTSILRNITAEEAAKKAK